MLNFMFQLDWVKVGHIACTILFLYTFVKFFPDEINTELVDLIKQFSLPDMGGCHPIHLRCKQTKKK